MKGHSITPRFAEKAFDNPKYQYNFYLICNHNITQYVSYKIEFGSTNDRSVKHTRAFRIRFSISRRSVGFQKRYPQDLYGWTNLGSQAQGRVVFWVMPTRIRQFTLIRARIIHDGAFSFRALSPYSNAGGFGENLTLAGMDEDSVCIGDIVRIGSSR